MVPKPDKIPLVRASLATSVDGYIADKHRGVEWLNPYFSPEIDFAGFMATIGAAVMGRNTFDVAMTLGMPPGGGIQKNIVLTHRPLCGAPAGFECFAGDLGQLVEQLRGELAGTGKDIWLMGGGLAIDAFARLDLVDRFELSIMPIRLGDGVPLFPPRHSDPRPLRLVRQRALKNEIVELCYERQ